MEAMDSPDTEERERLWNEKPSPRQIDPPDPDVHRRRKYHREYYHEHKHACKCEHCGRDYISMSSLRRHQGRSAKCKVQQLAKEVGELKDKLSAGILGPIDPEIVEKLNSLLT